MSPTVNELQLKTPLRRVAPYGITGISLPVQLSCRKRGTGNPVRQKPPDQWSRACSSRRQDGAFDLARLDEGVIEAQGVAGRVAKHYGLGRRRRSCSCACRQHSAEHRGGPNGRTDNQHGPDQTSASTRLLHTFCIGMTAVTAIAHTGAQTSWAALLRSSASPAQVFANDPWAQPGN